MFEDSQNNMKNGAEMFSTAAHPGGGGPPSPIPSESHAMIPIDPNQLIPSPLGKTSSPPTPLSAFPPGNVVRLPRTLDNDPVLYGPIANAGVTWQQAQELNKKYFEFKLELEKKWAEKNLDFQYDVAFETWKRSMEVGIAYPISVDGGAGCANFTAIGNGRIDLQAFTIEFLREKEIVRNRGALHRFELLIRESSSIRHRPVDTKDLRIIFEEELLDRIPPEVDVPQATIDRLFRSMLHHVPTVDNSCLQRLKETEIAFPNGIFDLQTGNFAPQDMRRFFTRFALDADFDPNAPAPPVFRALLDDMFDSDIAKVEHAYIELGAVISGVQTLKKIFAHQGVSNGGKSRLAAIYVRIVGFENVLILNSLADLTQDFIDKNAHRYRLVFIQEVADKKITATQANALKGYTGGVTITDAPEFKILLCSNHPFVTGNDGFLEPALANRFSVLPFPRVMTNADPRVAAFEDVYFEAEKPGIIRKALETFSRVVQNGKKFPHDFPVNDVVEKQDAQVASTASDQKRIEEVLSQPCVLPSRDRFDAIVDSLFELTDEVNPAMPAESAFALLNQAVPGLVVDVASLGKRLRTHFGEAFLKDRSNGKICYNLRLRVPADPAIQP